MVCPVLSRIEQDRTRRHGISRTFKKQQFHCIGVLGEDAEIDTLLGNGRAKRKTVPPHSINHGITRVIVP
jgi:hypothetical protein